MSIQLPKIILLLYLFAALTSQQVKTSITKLPFLLQHFQQHQLEDRSTSFTTFFFKHYGDGFAKHSSEHSHNQLPGKGEHSGAQSLEILKAFLSVVPTTQMKPFSAFVATKIGFTHTTSLLPSAHLSAIWQPPKA